ncbi:MAG: AAA family ATPase [Actinomycetota bacterium]
MTDARATLESGDAGPVFDVAISRLTGDDEGPIVAPVDGSVLSKAGVAEGGVVELVTERGRRLLTRVSPGGPDEVGFGAIRLSQQQMRALKAGIDDRISLRAVSVGPARRMVLEPLAPLIRPITEYEGELLAMLSARAEVVQPTMLLSVRLPDFRRDVLFRVLSVTPDQAFVAADTRLVVRTSTLPPGVAANLVTFDDVGGLQTEVEQIRELVECPLLFPRIYEQLGIEAPRGILLHGPPGVGKTYLARAIANEVGAHFLYINGPEILSAVQGGTEANLRSTFEEAMESAPSVVLIDEIDAIAPLRKDSPRADARMGTQLLSLLDGLVSMEDVVVIGTTNRIDAIDPALRRPGRFDREIRIGPPDAVGRLAILDIHTRGVPLSAEASAYLAQVAAATHGHTGADLVDLIRDAGLRALRRRVGPGLERLDDPERGVPDIEVERVDLAEALEHTRPSALREAVVTAPETRWSDIGGLEVPIRLLRETIEFPLLHPEAFAEIGLAPPRGVVLHGPPGTGKTLLATAIAGASGANLVTVNGPEIFSKWLGESEEHVRDAFQMARQSAPTVVLLDQLDAMAPVRASDSSNPASERVVNQLLIELDGLRGAAHIVVVAATNRLDIVDPALLRPGRLGLQVRVGLPDRDARLEILRIHLGPDVVDAPGWGGALGRVADETEGLAGADLAAMCDHAKLLALRDGGFERGGVLAPDHLARASEEIGRRGRWTSDDIPDRNDHMRTEDG